MPISRRLSVALLTLSLAVVAAVPALAGLRPVKHNPANALVSLPIDAYRYDHADRCRKSPARGRAPDRSSARA